MTTMQTYSYYCPDLIIYTLHHSCTVLVLILPSCPQGFGALGALFGGPVAAPISEWLGRKPALMIGGFPALIGWLMITYAHFMGTRAGFLAVLYVGRLITGFSGGWFILSVSVSN